LSPRSHPLGPSEIGFALHINRYPIGGVYLFDKAGDAAFTEEDDELLELFSSQAAVAIAHAQQLEQAEQGKRRLSSLYDQLAKTVARWTRSRLLDAAQVELGRIELQRRRLAIGDALQQLLDQLQPALRGRTIELTVQPNMPQVSVDLARLEEIVTN